MLAILAGPIEADRVAGWVDENRLAPQPGLINGLVLEIEAPRLEALAQGIKIFVFEIDFHTGFDRTLLCGMN